MRIVAKKYLTLIMKKWPIPCYVLPFISTKRAPGNVVRIVGRTGGSRVC